MDKQRKASNPKEKEPNFQIPQKKSDVVTYREQIEAFIIQILHLRCQTARFPFGEGVLVILQGFYFRPDVIVGGPQRSARKRREKRWVESALRGGRGAFGGPPLGG